MKHKKNEVGWLLRLTYAIIAVVYALWWLEVIGEEIAKPVLSVCHGLLAILKK
ncbi:hypothetical protein [Ruegeria arenilitoris]|uniref:hypothetical protein n=1 Tax=Ruegeria arenilitoris TaxID=1173585 RepID=UPI00147B4998|nr:hypothetical protein [Ruegeria arenilitoris]